MSSIEIKETKEDLKEKLFNIILNDDDIILTDYEITILKEHVTTMKHKRGRKSKDSIILLTKIQEYLTKNTEISFETNEKVVKKRRGRKPKGGKVVVDNKKEINSTLIKLPNIILQLNCSSSELYELNKNNDIKDITCYDPNIEDVKPNEEDSSISKNAFQYKNDNPTPEDNKSNKIMITKTVETNYNTQIKNEVRNEINRNIDIQNLNTKIVELSEQLENNITNDKSNCFWDTEEFNYNNKICIPKYILNDCYYVYGCFCSLNCAVASLFNEDIESSVKWERYALLVQMYSSVLDYDINIIPSPDPKYTLEKFYGNMNIEEYRNLYCLKLYVYIYDKPLICNLPGVFTDKTHSTIMDNDNSKYKLYRKNKQDNTNIFYNMKV